MKADTVKTDVVVIGGGPAGLAAAAAASNEGASVLLVEREAKLGGILKQCIHDGFGLIRFGEKLSGPEYAYREIEALERTETRVMLQTFVTRIEKTDNGFILVLVSKDGITRVETAGIVLATGCRERTAKQIAIHGTRPAGVFTAGNAQYYTNIIGQAPAKRCVILGSGDIGLIMARRLTLEGAEVIGVYEAKSTPGGLLRNIVQCVHDFDIPLHMSHTVTRVFGEQRLTAVEICRVDESLRPIEGTEQIIECDALILSVGLIPENELAESVGVELCRSTHGPVCDQNCMTLIDGIYSCGNAAHVNDLADYVSQSGEVAGRSAAKFAGKQHIVTDPTDQHASADSHTQDSAASTDSHTQDSAASVDSHTQDSAASLRGQRVLVDVTAGEGFLYAIPQRIDIGSSDGETIMFFRSNEVREKMTVRVLADGEEVFSRKFSHLRPPEMEKISVSFGTRLRPGSKVTLEMSEYS